MVSQDFPCAFLGDENVIRVWDLGSGRCMNEFSGHTDPIYSLAFSQEGTLLLSGAADNTVRAWDVKRGTDVSTHPIIAQRKQLNGQSKGETTGDSDKMEIDYPAGGSNATNGKEKDKTQSQTKNGTTTETSKKRDAKGSWKASRITDSEQLLKTWKTKYTPVYQIKFSKRNLAVAVGAFSQS